MRTRSHRARVLLAGVLAMLPALVAAQPWSLRGGLGARLEYSDNHFFTPDEPDSALVLSLTPAIGVAYRSETGGVVALLTVGGNRVFGTSVESDYLHGRFDVDASHRRERSTWSGNVAIARIRSIESNATPDGVVFALVYLSQAVVNTTYAYELGERWTIEATLAGYGNRYKRVQGEGPLQDNHAYAIGASARHLLSERTTLTMSATYADYESDVQRTSSVTALIAAVHTPLPRLSLSGTAGYVFADSRRRREDDVAGELNAVLFGGEVAYEVSESVRAALRVDDRLTPSAGGTVSRRTSAVVGTTWRPAEALAIRVGASYAREKFVAEAGDAGRSSYLTGEVALVYQPSRQWTIEAGYRRTQARYPQQSSEPQANAVFVGFRYDWPGGLPAMLFAPRPGTEYPGAGPVRPASSSPYGEAPVDDRWFDRLFAP